MGPPYAPKTCGIVPAFQSRERDTRGIRHEHRQRRRSAGSKALARELDQAADATVRAMNEVGSAPAALALYRRDEDVPPSTGLPTPGCHLALVRRVVERRPMCSWSLIVAAPIGRLGSRLDSEELRTAWVIQLKPRFGRGH